MKYIPNATKFGNLKLWILTRNEKLGQIWSQNCNVCVWLLWNLALRTNNMLIINTLIGIDDRDSNLQIWSQNWNFLQFLWNLALELLEHANYEYSTWNWWSWAKIIDSGKCGLKIEMCSNYHEFWHSGHFKISFHKVANLIKGLRNVKP